MQKCGIPWFSSGLYPSNAGRPTWIQDLSGLENHIKQELYQNKGDNSPRLVAIGEIGIDCHWNYGTVQDQMDLFIRQIELANQYHLPIIVHNREADEYILKAFSICPPAYSGIMHCFSSEYGFACKMLDFNLYISFAGNLTYQNSHAIKDAALRLPLEKIVLETDSPYLSPSPLRGQINTPSNVKTIYEYFAKMKGLSLEKCCQQIEENIKHIITSRL
jgi:TatD DNase family protein